MLETFNRLQDEALRLQAAGEPPEGARGQALAAAFLADGDGVHRRGHGNFGKADGDGKL